MYCSMILHNNCSMNIHDDTVKKRRRTTRKPYSRSIVGGTLEVILKKRTEKTEVWDAAREAALRNSIANGMIHLTIILILILIKVVCKFDCPLRTPDASRASILPPTRPGSFARWPKKIKCLGASNLCIKGAANEPADGKLFNFERLKIAAYLIGFGMYWNGHVGHKKEWHEFLIRMVCHMCSMIC